MRKDSNRNGQWKPGSIFRYYLVDGDGTGNNFETDQAKTDRPTLNLEQIVKNLKQGVINRIQYRMNPTNAETYTLRIWAHDVGAGPNAYDLNSWLLYESPSAQADDTDYDRAELEIPFILYDPGIMFYSLDWTGNPGNTPGYIVVSGRVVH